MTDCVRRTRRGRVREGLSHPVSMVRDTVTRGVKGRGFGEGGRGLERM